MSATTALMGPSIWDLVKADLREAISEEMFTLLFEPTVLLSHDSGCVTLGAPSSFAELWIQSNFIETLQSRFHTRAGQPMQVRIQVNPEARGGSGSPFPVERVAAPAAPAAPVVPTRRPRVDPASSHCSVPNPKNTFENFIVGSNNEMAHSVAISVAKAPGHAYNPLFIYGGSGLGKTHLMQAIGHYMMKAQPGARIQYVTAETFTNDFLLALEKKTISQFRDRYRRLDALLIDDVHFLASKERTQEEFFHLFNDLHTAHKQIVLTSDRAVSEIEKLQHRLVSRFQWGMTADITPPDLETRLAILRAKAASYNLSHPVPASVLAYIAEHVTSHIRQLEGALLRVVSYSNHHHRPIDTGTVETLLRDILMDEAKRQVTVERIQAKVVEHFGLRPSDMQSRRRPNNIALPRMIAMHLSRELTRLSLQAIGEAFGGRDHGTVIHACRTVRNLTESDPSLRQTVENLRSQLSR